jgi:DnaK suppressor protein
MPKAKTKKAVTAPKKKAATAKPAAKPKKAAAKAKPREAKPASKRASFKRQMSKILVTAKTKMLQEVAHKIRSETSEQKLEIGDIYDLASSERERELTLTLGDRDRGKIAEIEDALERIGDGSYGDCEECGDPIAENRLRALPFTRVCIECQSKHERDQRIRGGPQEEHPVGMIDRSASEEEEY